MTDDEARHGLERLCREGDPPSMVYVAQLESTRNFIARRAVLHDHYDLSNLGVGLHVAMRFDNI